MGLGFLCIAEGRGEGEGENKREGADGRSDGWEHQIIKRKEKGYVPSLGEVETAGMWESHSFFFFFSAQCAFKQALSFHLCLTRGIKHVDETAVKQQPGPGLYYVIK